MDTTRQVMRRILTEEADLPLGERLKRVYALELEHAELKADPEAEFRQDIEGRIKRLEMDARPLIQSIADDLYDEFEGQVDYMVSDHIGAEDEPDWDEGDEVDFQDKLQQFESIARELGDLAGGKSMLPFGQMMVTFHRALMTAHYNGFVLDAIAEKHPDVTYELLDQLSAGRW